MTTSAVAMRRNQNLTRTSTRLQTGPLTVSFMFIALVILLSLLYLNQVTKTSTFNYRISSLDNKRKELESLKEKRQIEAARLQSLSSVRDSAAVGKMVTVDEVSYADAH